MEQLKSIITNSIGTFAVLTDLVPEGYYETMVFKSSLRGYVKKKEWRQERDSKRYKSEAEATKGHYEMVNKWFVK